jgi:hypothetical protein
MRRGLQLGPEEVDPFDTMAKGGVFGLVLVALVAGVCALLSTPAHATITDDITPFHTASPVVGDDSQYHATGIVDSPDTNPPTGAFFLPLPAGAGVYLPLDFCSDFPQATYCVHQRRLIAQQPTPAPTVQAPCPPPPSTGGATRSGTGPGSSEIPR